VEETGESTEGDRLTGDIGADDIGSGGIIGAGEAV
jgi:hypothetical protein